jgi:hypothetical protein
MNLDNILDAIHANRLRISDHADEEAVADRLAIDDIFFSVLHGEIIENYPTDRPFPSCLVFGKTSDGAPVHSVWAYNADVQWAVLITVYRPDPERWIHWRERKKR